MADDINAEADAFAPLRPAPPPDPHSLEARLWAAIRDWRDSLIAGGPIARTTDCWNHLQDALQPLAASILKEL